MSYEVFLGDDYEFSDNRTGPLDFLELLIDTYNLPPPLRPPLQWTEMPSGRKWGGIFVEEAGSSGG
jgi:hypothetical protein